MKAPILNFGTSCDQCGRGLFIDCDGDKFCADCTSFAPVILEPFVACVGYEVVEESPNLDDLLATLREILDDKGPDDVCVWQGQRVVLILLGDGSVIDRRARS